MSKKGPRSEAFNLLTGSLSEEVITHYLELAYYVRDQELARRREIERRKAAIKRAKLAAMRAAWEAAARAAGIPIPERPGKAKVAKKVGKSKAGKGKAAKGKGGKGTAEKGKGSRDKSGTGAVRPKKGGAVAAPVATSVAVIAAAAEAAVNAADAAHASGADAAPPEPAGAAEDDGLPKPVDKKSPVKSRARKPVTREDILKLYVADSLGYLDKVRADGWGGLTCAESGRVGGMMTRRMKRVEKGLPIT